MKHLKDAPHLTTEQIASKASQARGRAFTVDTPQTPDSPVKTEHPIISNQYRKQRTISQPLTCPPIKPQSIQDELQLKLKTQPLQNRTCNKENNQISLMQNWFKETLSHSQTPMNRFDFYATFKDGNALAFIISRLRPELLDMIEVEEINSLNRLKRVFKIADKHFGVSPMFSAAKFLFQPDKLEVIRYLMHWYDYFKRESTNNHKNALWRIYNKLTFESEHEGIKREDSLFAGGQEQQDNMCRKCNQFIYITEKVSAEGYFFHRKCFTCEFAECNTQLTSNNCSVSHNEDSTVTFLCPYHFCSIESSDFATSYEAQNHVKHLLHLTASQATDCSDTQHTPDSLVKETIENHPHEVKALKEKHTSLKEEIATRDNNNPTHIVQPDICQTLSIVPESVSSVPLEDDTSVELTRTATQSTDQLLSVDGQSALYRSNRYKNTRTTSTQSPQNETLDVSIDTSQSIGDEDDSSSDSDSDSDEAQAENQKEQDAFRRAMELDEKMDVLNQKMEQLEENGKYYEYKIRNNQNSNDEIMMHYLKEWSKIIHIKNNLLREDRDLSLEFKEMQLKDELYRVENELRRKQETDLNFQGAESKALSKKKITIIQEMDDLVAQVREDKNIPSIWPLSIQNFIGAILSEAPFIDNPKEHFPFVCNFDP